MSNINMPNHPSSFPLSVSTLLLLLLAIAGTTAAVSNGGIAASGSVTTANTTGGNNNSTAADRPAANNNGPETYTCVLCAGRDLMLIHWCPIYWDQCHLVCNNNGAATNTAVAPEDDGTGGLASAAIVPDADPGDDDECYVMKLYNGGRQVIVATMKCGQVKTCGLTCGGGEILGAGKNAMPAAAFTPVVPVATAAFQGRRLADSERCGVEAAMAAFQRGA